MSQSACTSGGRLFPSREESASFFPVYLFLLVFCSIVFKESVSIALSDVLWSRDSWEEVSSFATISSSISSLDE